MSVPESHASSKCKGMRECHSIDQAMLPKLDQEPTHCPTKSYDYMNHTVPCRPAAPQNNRIVSSSWQGDCIGQQSDDEEQAIANLGHGD